MSMSATPMSLSSCVSTASAAASCSSTTSSTSTPARFTPFTRFWAAVTEAVTMCTLASSLAPVMPTGSWMPSWSSTVNSCGRTWKISRSEGMLTARAALSTRCTSSRTTSWSRPETATTPRLLRPRTWAPAMPTKARSTEHPAISSASSTACLIDATQASRFTTTPLRMPREGHDPTPMMSTEPVSAGSAISAQTLVVPMSRPTIRLLVLAMSVRPRKRRLECDAVLEPEIDVGPVAEARREVAAQRQVAIEVGAVVLRVEAHHGPSLVQAQIEPVVVRQIDLGDLRRQAGVRRPKVSEEADAGRDLGPAAGRVAFVDAGEDGEGVTARLLAEGVDRDALIVHQPDAAPQQGQSPGHPFLDGAEQAVGKDPLHGGPPDPAAGRQV